ncbi:toxin-antitoxin system YwqK family antitoxin [Acidobacteriota bacterium]
MEKRVVFSPLFGIVTIIILGLIALVLLLSFWHGEEFRSVKQLYDDGKAKEEWLCLRNLFGKDEKIREITYYENGEIETDVQYKDGTVNGWAREYFENGDLHFEATYKDSIPHGIRRAYYENGKLFCLACYYEGEIICKKNWDKEGNEIEPLPFDRE